MCLIFFFCFFFFRIFFFGTKGLPMNLNDYLESRINYTLMEVVYEWAKAMVG